jgi:23S rRNA pseudouridine2604 synthase
MAKRTKRLTEQGDEKDEVRINKFLSEAGVCSRREADRYILEGKVKIDGIVAEMGSKVRKGNQVTFCDKPVIKEEKLVLIAFNKPEGIVCTTDPSEPDNIVDFIHYGMRIYPIGRLDKDSEGLILLTNEGNIVNRILRAENKHEKEYVVTVNKEITPEFITSMSSGVPILDTVTNPCEVKQIDKNTFDIVLTQGLNRQIRRMCEYLGYRVMSLRRIRIMNINLGRLKTGDYRNVTEKEIEELNQSFQQQKAGRESDNKRESVYAAGVKDKHQINTADKKNSQMKTGTANNRKDNKDNKSIKRNATRTVGTKRNISTNNTSNRKGYITESKDENSRSPKTHRSYTDSHSGNKQDRSDNRSESRQEKSFTAGSNKPYVRNTTKSSYGRKNTVKAGGKR